MRSCVIVDTVAFVVALAFVFGPSTARAAGLRSPYERGQHVPPLPSPFLLPELAHPGIDLRVDGLLGRLVPEGNDRTAAMVSVTRVSVEGSILVPRRLFVGLLYPFASALPPDGGLSAGEPGRPAGQQLLSGNIEGHLRAVFPLPTSLEIGFGLSVVAPTATTDRDRASRSAALAASSLDPTNMTLFLPGRVALRPAGDLRIVRGPLVLQGRHGIDIMIDGLGIESATVAGRLLAHAGWLVSGDLEVSVEASQLYFFASEEKVDGAQSFEQAFSEKYRITDRRRSALTIGPGIRYSTREVDVGASLVTNLADPLSPASVGFIGMRLSVIGHAATDRGRER
jgi:hypothetical protein